MSQVPGLGRVLDLAFLPFFCSRSEWHINEIEKFSSKWKLQQPLSDADCAWRAGDDLDCAKHPKDLKAALSQLEAHFHPRSRLLEASTPVTWPCARAPSTIDSHRTSSDTLRHPELIDHQIKPNLTVHQMLLARSAVPIFRSISKRAFTTSSINMGVEIERIAPGDGKTFPQRGDTVHMHCTSATTTRAQARFRFETLIGYSDPA